MATIFDDFSSIGALDNAPTSDSNGVWTQVRGGMTKAQGTAKVTQRGARQTLYALGLVGRPDYVETVAAPHGSFVYFRVRDSSNHWQVQLSVISDTVTSANVGFWSAWQIDGPITIWATAAQSPVDTRWKTVLGVQYPTEQDRRVHWTTVAGAPSPPDPNRPYIQQVRTRTVVEEARTNWQHRVALGLRVSGALVSTGIPVWTGEWQAAAIVAPVPVKIVNTVTGFQVFVGDTKTHEVTDATHENYFTVGIGGELNTFFESFEVEVSITEPNAPDLVSFWSTQALDRTIRLGWVPSFKAVGDVQQSAEVRWRQDAGAWTTISIGGGRAYTDIAAHTFVTGQVEWQARTANQHSIWGPWSPSEFFGVAPSPPGPQILDPINNSQIILPSYPVVWTAEGQQSFQIRRVADLAGSPELGTIYFDTGEIVSTEREYEVAFPVEGQFEHLQLRVKDQGIWSGWDSVRVEVSYSPPSAPEANLFVLAYRGLRAGFRVLVVHVQETGTPDVERLEVWRRETGEDGLGVRLAAGIPANTVFDDWAVASGVDYEYRIRAVGVNQSTAWSEWVGAQPQSVVETVGGGLLWLTGRDW